MQGIILAIKLMMELLSGKCYKRWEWNEDSHTKKGIKKGERPQNINIFILKIHSNDSSEVKLIL